MIADLKPYANIQKSGLNWLGKFRIAGIFEASARGFCPER